MFGIIMYYNEIFNDSYVMLMSITRHNSHNLYIMVTFGPQDTDCNHARWVRKLYRCVGSEQGHRK